MADGKASDKDFEGWLSARLNQIGLDEEIFGSYVTGLMDAEDSTDEERTEGLAAILVGNTEHSIEELCEEILNKWKMSRADVLQKQKEEKERQTAATKKDKLAEIMEKQASTVTTTKSSHTKVDPSLKKQLMAQYAHQSDEEQYSDSDGEAGDAVKANNTSAKDIFKNENVQSVMKQEKEKRDKMKQENEQKKQQIKEAKEKQRQKAEERKEKEKKRTQKGERRMR